MNALKTFRTICAMAILFIYPLAAYAHIDAGAMHGFNHGILHPLTGADHVIAMLGVGILAFKIGKNALWALPGTFIAMMIIGGVMSVFSVPLSYVEIGITLSVFVIGLMLSMTFSVSAVAAALIIGFFAVFHGFAHGAEMVSGVSSVAYGLGFLVSTLILHIAGILLAFGINKISNLSFKYAV